MRLHAALVTPISGPLAQYGRASRIGLQLWAARAATLPASWRGVELEVVDAHPNPAKAMLAAVAGRPDLVFGPYGSGPAVAALAATDRAVWNHGGATSRLRWREFPRVLNVLAPAASYFDGALRAIRGADPHAGMVALLHAATGFGRDVGGGAAITGQTLGFAVHARAFAPGSATIAATDLPPAEVLLVAGGFEDELAAARALLSRPWKAAAFVGAGVEDVLADLGSLREGLLGPAQWLAETAPAPDEGPDAAWFVEAHQRVTGTDPPYPAAQAFAAGLIAARCMREAGSADDDALLGAARTLVCTTFYGRFRLDPSTGLQAGHQVATVQWQDGARRRVWPPLQPQRALRYPLPRPAAWSR